MAMLGDLTVCEEPGVTWREDEAHIWEHGQEYRVLHMEHRDPETGKLLCVAEILKPVLTPEEYEKRRARVEEAAAALFRAVENRRMRDEEKKGAVP